VSDLSQAKEAAIREVDRLEARLWDLSKRIHATPELSYEEVQAAAWITGELEEMGFTVERGAGGLATAFKASYEGSPGGPTIALQAEYDALPDLGHACGHNLIATTAVGGAAAVKAALGDRPGRIVVMGTPAEERGGGKITMLENGAYDDIDAALYFHAQTRNAVMSGNLAMTSMTVRFYGVPASKSGGKAVDGQEHAGASAVNALISCFNNVNAIRQHIQKDVIVKGIITSGGSKAEWVPLFAEAWFSLRGPSHHYLRELVTRITNCAEAAGLAIGTRVEVIPESVYEERFPNRPLMDSVKANMEALGLPDIKEDGIAPSSTDSGNVNQLIPLLGLFLAIAPPGITPHSKAFAEASISDLGRVAMANGAKVLALSALDLLMQPEFLTKVQDDFRAHTGREPGRRAGK